MESPEMNFSSKIAKFVLGFLLLVCSVIASKAFVDVHAANERAVVGVNVVGVDLASDQQQDALIAELQRYGVKTIRTALGGHGERYTGFAIKAFQHGIGSVVMVSPFAGNTGKHALPVDKEAGRPWGLPALSDADPEGFTKWFAPTLAKLEAAGVRITAFEAGNELNTPRFNADFRPEDTSSRILGLSDLNNPRDREAATVASGYRAYIKILEALKDSRDHAKVNQKTPILSGMSADWNLAGPRKKGGGVPDAVSIPDSIQFLRQNGADKFLDGYAVHTYPTGDPKVSVATRVGFLEQRGILSQCKQGAKPCWMTEWGFNNTSQSCPLDDSTRAKAIQEERAAFKQFADQGRLAAILFYSWSGVVPFSWEKVDANRKADPGAIFRCGALTNAGKLALEPL
jgi:hypothetical protein